MMRYMSVHDLVWIDSVVTGVAPEFQHDNAEACMAAQYGYGNSTDVLGQASALLDTLIRVRPFDQGNVRTAYVATIAFLMMNGRRLRLAPAELAEAVARVASGEQDASAAVEVISEPCSGSVPVGSVRPLVTRICGEHADALRRLAERD